MNPTPISRTEIELAYERLDREYQRIDQEYGRLARSQRVHALWGAFVLGPLLLALILLALAGAAWPGATTGEAISAFRAVMAENLALTL
jgi:hypothetical protein